MPTKTTTLPTIAIGADPGAHGGLSLVEHRGAGRRPRLLLCLPITGSRSGLWLARAVDQCRLAVGTLAGLGVSGPALRSIPTWMEEPPYVKSADSNGGSKGLAAWAGIGRQQGLLFAAMVTASDGLIELERRPMSDWPAVLGKSRAASKKFGDHTHRVREVAYCLDGGREAMDVLAAHSAQVDAAESALIALAALLDARGERAYPDHALPSERRKAAQQATKAPVSRTAQIRAGRAG